jgi:hypothetical protein
LKYLPLVAEVVILACVQASGEVVKCSVNGSSADMEINLTAPLQGQLDIYVVCPTLPSTIKTINAELTQFQGDGVSIPVDLLVPPDYKTPKGPQNIDFIPPLVRLRLAVNSFPAFGKYSGLLVLTPEGREPLVWKITLSHVAPSATLVVGRPSSWQVTRPFLGWREEFGPLRKSLCWLLEQIGWCSAGDPLFYVTLWEKSGQSSLEGISVHLDQVSKQPESDFSVSRNVDFTFKGKDIPDFEVLPGRGDEDRSIVAGAAPVEMKFKFLQTGEYNFFLSFRALNSVWDDSQQKVNFVIQVRDSCWWAVLWLITAVAVSFVSFKVLASLRRRYGFLQEIRDLRPGWLSDEPPALAIVWVKSELKLTEELTKRFWLTDADRLDTRIARLKSVLPFLGEIRDTRLKLKHAGMPQLLYNRALGYLDKIVSRLGEAGLDDAAFANFNADLTAFGNWLGPDSSRDNCYWVDLCDAIARLQSEVFLTEIQVQDVKDKMVGLQGAIVNALNSTSPPADLESKMAVERQYAALKLLWERRNDRVESEDLASLILSSPAVDYPTLKNMFAKADANAWERLKKADIRILTPQSDGPDLLQAYEPLRFELQVNDPILDRTYLFQHGLQFHWTLTFEYRRTWLRIPVQRSNKLLLTPLSTEPRVVQYVPRSGLLAVKVHVQNGVLSFDTPGTDPAHGALKIATCADFGTFRGLAKVEMVSWALAAMIAVVTGLSTFYFKGPTFGSFQDYLTLFLWGAGVDQGKNFLQVLQTYSPTKQV